MNMIAPITGNTQLQADPVLRALEVHRFAHERMLQSVEAWDAVEKRLIKQVGARRAGRILYGDGGGSGEADHLASLDTEFQSIRSKFPRASSEEWNALVEACSTPPTTWRGAAALAGFIRDFLLPHDADVSDLVKKALTSIAAFAASTHAVWEPLGPYAEDERDRDLIATIRRRAEADALRNSPEAGEDDGGHPAWSDYRAATADLAGMTPLTARGAIAALQLAAQELNDEATGGTLLPREAMILAMVRGAEAFFEVRTV